MFDGYLRSSSPSLDQLFMLVSACSMDISSSWGLYCSLKVSRKAIASLGRGTLLLYCLHLFRFERRDQTIKVINSYRKESLEGWCRLKIGKRTKKSR